MSVEPVPSAPTPGELLILAAQLETQAARVALQRAIWLERGALESEAGRRLFGVLCEIHTKLACGAVELARASGKLR